MREELKAVKIGLLGFGVVGQGVWKNIEQNRSALEARLGVVLEIAKVVVRDLKRERSVIVPKSLLTSEANELLEDDSIDIICELIGGTDLALTYTQAALKKGKIVVSANKALICDHGENIFELARQYGGHYFYEASVAGGIPIIKTMREALVANRFNLIFGILNGTSNYILSEMESTKHSFKEVLKKAQYLGYAEPGNPKLDLNGYDALAKVKILSSLSFNNKISNSKYLMEGIENIEYKDIEIVDQLDYRIKLLGITEIVNKQLFERVHPCLVKKNTYIGNVNGVMNAVITHGHPVGESILQGEGAGPGPTSSALMSDLLSILRGNIKYPFGIPDFKRKKVKVYDVKNYLNSLYLRFEVKDKPGVLSQITKQLANKNISVERLIQIPNHKHKTASIVIITHKSNELDVQTCLKSFKSSLLFENNL